MEVADKFVKLIFMFRCSVRVFCISLVFRFVMFSIFSKEHMSEKRTPETGWKTWRALQICKNLKGCARCCRAFSMTSWSRQVAMSSVDGSAVVKMCAGSLIPGCQLSKYSAISQSESGRSFWIPHLICGRFGRLDAFIL